MKKKILPKKNLWLILWHLLWVRWYQRRGQRWMQDGRLPAHGTMEAEALLRGAIAIAGEPGDAPRLIDALVRPEGVERF